MNWYRIAKLAATGAEALKAIHSLMGNGRRGDNGIVDRITSIKSMPAMREFCTDPECYKLFKNIDATLARVLQDIEPNVRNYTNAQRMASQAINTYQQLTMRLSQLSRDHILKSNIFTSIQHDLEQVRDQLEFVVYLNHHMPQENNPVVQPTPRSVPQASETQNYSQTPQDQPAIMGYA